MELKFDYQEPQISSSTPQQRIDDLVGTFPYTTAAPTWIPKTFRDQFAIALISGTYYFYIYDTTNTTWRRATLA